MNDSNENENDLLPFLISHWLTQPNQNDQIRALGQKLSIEFCRNSSGDASYNDITRRWPNLPGDHLRALVESGARVSYCADDKNTYDLLQTPKFGSESDFKKFRSSVVQQLKQSLEQRLDCLAVQRELSVVNSSLSLSLSSSTSITRTHNDNEIGIAAYEHNENENNNRVLNHLQQRQLSLHEKLENVRKVYEKGDYQAKAAFERLKYCSRLFDMSFCNKNSNRNNLVLSRSVFVPSFVSRREQEETMHMRLIQRMEHELTINCHQFYPIYCLVLDKTGRYFVTGADDHLVKVFRLGGYMHTDNEAATTTCHSPSQTQTPHKGLQFSYTNGSAAVLALTLRGHNNVITDLDVNCDNLLLASASEDGTVRIWGLENGEIVAVLRHIKLDVQDANNNDADLVNVGVNMVKFDLIKPTLVYTIAEDGYCRIWDVRGAVLLRCLQKSPLINAYEVPSSLVSSNGNNDSNNNNNIVLPPLPGHFPQGQQQESNSVDQGCRLLQKLNHIEVTQQDRTRANKSKQNVLCISTNPAGEDFVTGSGDGFVRLWKCQSQIEQTLSRTTSGTSTFNSHQQQPILFYPPFQSALTDLMYSNKGDRILAGALKDAKVRVWSTSISHNRTASNQRPLIEIRLSSNGTIAVSKGILCDVATWSCDDALIFTSESSSNPSIDKARVSLVKAWCSYTGSILHVIPTPQPADTHSVLDTKNIANACIIPHPLLPTIFAIGSSAGVLSIYVLNYKKPDYETRLIYNHVNVVKHGPVGDENVRNKAVGYLEGSWIGNNKDQLIMVDEGGRISLYNNIKRFNYINFPSWLTEQYFANDYYELAYDPNLYPIDIRSNTLPHLAPRGARTDSQGSSNLDHVSEGNYKVPGPRCLCNEESLSRRAEVQEKRDYLVQLWNYLKNKRSSSVYGMPLPLNQPKTCVTMPPTINTGYISNQQVNSSRANLSNPREPRQLSANYRYLDYAPDSPSEHSEDDEEFTVGVRNSGLRAGRRSMESDSSEDDDLSIHDVEEGRPRRRQARPMASDSDPSPRRRRRPSNIRHRTSVFERISSANGNAVVLSSEDDNQSLELHSDGNENSMNDSAGSDDEANMWFYTSNPIPTPSHPQVINFPDDYQLPDNNNSSDIQAVKYLWHLPNNNVRTSRQWLQRKTFYQPGRQTFLPQPGDECMYIPHVHQLTIETYKNVPHGHRPENVRYAEVLQCKCLRVRYRFVDSESVTQRCASVVAVCSMKVIGVPDQSERCFPWIRHFVVESGDNAINFEVTVMQNNQPEYLIPCALYKMRLENLETILNYQLNKVDHQRSCSHGRRSRSSRTYISNDQFFDKTRIQLVSYYAEDVSNELADPRLEPSKCFLKRIHGSKTDGFQFSRSDHTRPINGYECLEVEYPESGTCELISPWETDCVLIDSIGNTHTELLQSIKVTTLSESTRDELKSILSENLPEELYIEPFKCPVDTSVYRDYLKTTPVPICIEFIFERLEGKYYSSKMSLVNDIDVLLENCLKYNASDADVSICAKNLYKFWKERINQLEGSGEVTIYVDLYESDVKGLLRSANDASSMNDEDFLNGGGLLSANEVSSNVDIAFTSNLRQQRSRQRHSSSTLETLNNHNQSDMLETSRRRSSRQSFTHLNEQTVSTNGRGTGKRTDQNNSSSSQEDDDDEEEKSRVDFNGSDSSPHPIRITRNRKAITKFDCGSSGYSSSQNSDSEDDQKLPAHSKKTKNKLEVRQRTIKSQPKPEPMTSSDSDELSSSEESEHSSPPQKRTRRTSSFTKKSSTQKVSSRNRLESIRDSSQRRTRTSQVQYQEIDSDDALESEQEDVMEENLRRSRANKKYKIASPRKKQKKGSFVSPELPVWPRIVNRRQITKVGKCILAAVKDLDEQNVFGEPVTDDLIPGYSTTIEQPIALNIIEGKLSHYSDINELKDDLCLMLRNCCVFNGEGDYQTYALGIWSSLQDLFLNACAEARIRNPSR